MHKSSIKIIDYLVAFILKKIPTTKQRNTKQKQNKEIQKDLIIVDTTVVTSYFQRGPFLGSIN